MHGINRMELNNGLNSKIVEWMEPEK